MPILVAVLRHRSATSQFWNCISKSCWGRECWSVMFVLCCETSSLCNKLVTCAEEANHSCVYHSCEWASNHRRGSLGLILNVMSQKKENICSFYCHWSYSAQVEQNFVKICCWFPGVLKSLFSICYYISFVICHHYYCDYDYCYFIKYKL